MYNNLSLQAARVMDEELRRSSSRPEQLMRHELGLVRRSRRRRRRNR